MISPIEIVTLPAQPTATVALQIPASDIRTAMGAGLNELHAALKAQRIAQTGPWFTHHLRAPGATFDFEIHLPIASSVAEAGRVRPGQRPGLKVARAVYSGGYETLGNAWGQFLEALSAQGIKTTEDLWEVYAVGPESGPDASAYRTELIKPIAE
ncbi:GyrI-like domain-containing protein [Asticcacaulis solisilvae]|uniref:GyrI-like domain-containing protein n=1 Tax=Asticcacaulis solisilvae TaxID=1217274 RepID=UPI003FD72E49